MTDNVIPFPSKGGGWTAVERALRPELTTVGLGSVGVEHVVKAMKSFYEMLEQGMSFRFHNLVVPTDLAETLSARLKVAVSEAYDDLQKRLLVERLNREVDFALQRGL